MEKWKTIRQIYNKIGLQSFGDRRNFSLPANFLERGVKIKKFTRGDAENAEKKEEMEPPASPREIN